MLHKFRQQKEATYYPTRVCVTQKNFAKSIKVPNKDALELLKKRLQLLESEFQSSKEALEEEKEDNCNLIQVLRKEIKELRLAALHPGANEYLLRQALITHHTGSSIFGEKEPRDVIDPMHFKLSDLTNQLNALRHEVEEKNRRLENVLRTFNDTVEDVVYLELEGPMGDSRCLDLENQIGDAGTKIINAATLQHTYRHIIDQLMLEHLTHETSLEALEKLQQREDERLAACLQSLEQSEERKTAALETAHKMEFDSHAGRKNRNRQLANYKRLADEQRHELAHVRKDLQAYFAYQESVPLSRNMSCMLPRDSLGGLTAVGIELHDLRADAQVLETVTDCHSIQELVERFEQQQVTWIHLLSMVKEAEVHKSELLGRLEGLGVRRAASAFHSPPPEDAQLAGAGDRRTVK